MNAEERKQVEEYVASLGPGERSLWEAAARMWETGAGVCRSGQINGPAILGRPVDFAEVLVLDWDQMPLTARVGFTLAFAPILAQISNAVAKGSAVTTELGLDI